MQKKALIYGITGQDGSYLAELLLLRGYDVTGIARRVSVPTLQRLTHILPQINILEGDITDQFSVMNSINYVKPDEIYNLAAQSHVATSFTQPTLTFITTANGCMNILEAIRSLSLCDKVKFYQASSSEMFGRNYNIAPDGTKYQDEQTPFMPQSPYAIAKVAAHNLVDNYRRSYGIFGCSGVLFNHECFKYDTPVMIKSCGVIDIISVEDLAMLTCGFNRGPDNKYGVDVNGVQVWDNDDWTDIKRISWFKNKDKNLNIINARNSIYCVSDDHKCILEDNSVLKSEEMKLGDRGKLGGLPNDPVENSISTEEAELMGMIVGDGSVCSSRQFVNKDQDILHRFGYLWEKVTGGKSQYYPSTSGFTNEIIGRLDFSGGEIWLRSHKFYSNSKSVYGHKYKVVPTAVLNSNKDIMEAFLVGYNVCDGLKSNPCKYRFKNFKTNSPMLASGLVYLISKVTGQKYNLTVEESWVHGKQQFYYSINLLSDRTTSIEKYNQVKNLLDLGLAQREIHRRTRISREFIRKVKDGYLPSKTHHLELCHKEIKKIIKIDSSSYSNYFFDLETETNTLSAGIGQAVVHNSERRGEKFVTRKITKWISKWYTSDKKDTFPKLALGNLDAKRDWGHAEDYVRAMWLMLQQEEADDYVISTEKTHTVRDFLDASFNVVGVKDWSDLVVIDPQFYRPSEVDYLLGKCTKAKEVLEWCPKVDFQELARRMVENDINEERLRRSQLQEVQGECS